MELTDIVLNDALPPTKLPPDVKAEWIRRLRSGKYAQTRGQLCRKSPTGELSYCCLGVLADQLLDGLPEDAYHCANLGVLQMSNVTTVNYAALNNVVRVLERSIADSTIFSISSELINMNDQSRMSFAEIADWVETHL